MVWVLAIVGGLIVGWVINAVSSRNVSIWLDLLVGAIGGVIGQWFFGVALGIGRDASPTAYAWLGLVWGIIGALVIDGIVRAFMGTGEAKKLGTAYHEEIRRRKDDDDRIR